MWKAHRTAECARQSLQPRDGRFQAHWRGALYRAYRQQVQHQQKHRRHPPHQHQEKAGTTQWKGPRPHGLRSHHEREAAQEKIAGSWVL